LILALCSDVAMDYYNMTDIADWKVGSRKSKVESRKSEGRNVEIT
jgi:hypothetical protein